MLPVRVQGVEAPPEIVGAIRYANRWQVADLMIVGRGGGSVEEKYYALERYLKTRRRFEGDRLR